MVEGVIYCATHGKPLGECRHPVLGGEVSDATKHVSQQQRARGGHMRAFVTQERIDSDPYNGGIRGEGVPDAWARQNTLPVIRAVKPPPSMRAKAAALEESARRMVAEFDRAWMEEEMSALPRDPPPRPLPDPVRRYMRARGWSADDAAPETVAYLQAVEGAAKRGIVTALEQEMRNRGDGLVDVRMTDDEERRVLDELHRRMDDLHVPPPDPAATDEAFGTFLFGWELPPYAPPKKWSWAWWCREWRFLGFRLRWWLIKRLGGDE